MTTQAPAWMSLTLRLAAVYNLVWGAVVIIFPGLFFSVAGMEPPLYPQIWQCVGMIVGVYGVGYWVAASDPIRHWPIVLVGLLGKVLGPIGFAIALIDGVFPPVFGLTILTNDLVWWIPFGVMLWAAARASAEPADSNRVPLDEAMRTVTDIDGESVRSHSERAPLLLVCLRHSGCVFCREALADLGSRRTQIESDGARIALLHMGEDDDLRTIAEKHGLGDAPRFSNPDATLYRALELGRGSFLTLFGPAVVWRGIVAALRGHRVGRMVGDGFQMPGVFLIDDGRVVRGRPLEHAGERPDYESMACPLPGAQGLAG